MKRVLLFFLVLLILITTGCSSAEVSPTALPIEHTGTTSPSDTPVPTLQPISTQSPTKTPLPTVTETSLPTATQTPQVISAESGRGLTLSAQLGGGAMLDVALAPDASFVVVLTTLILQRYAVESGNLIWEAATERAYQEVAVSDDGSQVIARTRAGTVQRWDAADGEKLGEPLPMLPNTRYISMSGNGAVLISLDKFDQTFLWDTTTGEALQTNNGLAFPFGAIDAAASADGQKFLNSGIDSKINYQIRVWDARSGRFITGLRGLVAPVRSLQFSPDGQYVAALGTRVSGGLRGMQNLYLWRAEDGTLLDTVDLSLDVSTYNFLADGSTVLAGTAQGMVLFVSFRFGERFSYGYIRDQIFAHEAPVISLSSSVDGLNYASAAADGNVKVWDVSSGEAIFSTQVEDLSLLTISEQWIYEQLAVSTRYHYPGAAISPAGNLLARTARDLQSIDLLDLQLGEVVANLQIENPGYFTAPVFSPDGQTVAAVFESNRIILWDVASGLDKLRITTQHTQPINQLQYSPDGRQIASLGKGELFVWDLETVRLAHSLTAFRAFSYSADGSLIVTDAQEEGVYLVDAGTGRKLGLIETDHVNDLDVSPDVLQIAIAGYRSPARYEQENLVYFLDVTERKRIPTIELSGSPAEVMDVAYTPDGSSIASIDLYGNLSLWNAAAGTLLQRFEERVVLPAEILFSLDGRTMLIASGDNTIQLYQIQP